MCHGVQCLRSCCACVCCVQRHSSLLRLSHPHHTHTTPTPHPHHTHSTPTPHPHRTHTTPTPHPHHTHTTPTPHYTHTAPTPHPLHTHATPPYACCANPGRDRRCRIPKWHFNHFDYMYTYICVYVHMYIHMYIHMCASIVSVHCLYRHGSRSALPHSNVTHQVALGSGSVLQVFPPGVAGGRVFSCPC